jgi:endonuclease G
MNSKRSVTKPFQRMAVVVSLLLLAACDANSKGSDTKAKAPTVQTTSELINGFKQCHDLFPGVLPRVPHLAQRQPRDLCYDAFAVLYSGQSKTPIFVAERLTAEQLADAADEKRTNRFFADARLPWRERAMLEDYKGSGFDRGHMAPAADMPTAQAMAQSFSLANCVPQARVNNQRAWAGIEKATRRYVKRASGPVYVFSGPVHMQSPAQTIGDNRVWVPTHLYKLVYDQSTGRAWAHWIENTNEARAGKPISYSELVSRTGIEFLPGRDPKD